MAWMAAASSNCHSRPVKLNDEPFGALRMSILIILHVLAAVVWVGGMFFWSVNPSDIAGVTRVASCTRHQL